MFIGFLEYVISQIVAKPGYIPGDYVGANDLFSEEGAHAQWDTYQVNNTCHLMYLDPPAVMVASRDYCDQS